MATPALPPDHPPHPPPPPPPLRTRRPPPKGVEFSDKLTVLGDACRTHSLPPPAPSLPKARVFVRRGSVARKELLTTTYSDHPDNPRSISSHFEHTTVVEDLHPTQHLSPTAPPAFYPEEDVETSCTDSDTPPDEGGGVEHILHDYSASTRINTKLNSLPSGGAFSLMNSSEDVHSRSVASESSCDDVRSRRMVRVDGSAKLSTASGLADDDEENDDDDEDEFGIEGAERVEEEEALHVRSFGRSFARVSLKKSSDANKSSQATLRDPRQSLEHPDIDLDLDVDATVSSDEEDVCTPPSRRKSRIRLTFSRRTTATTMRRSLDARPLRSNTTEVSDMGAALSCFPNRRTMVVKRAKTASPAGSVPAAANAGAMIAVPDFSEAAGRKMVKNVSMQRDDWIDFATNAASRQRHPWLVRLVSLHGSPAKEEGEEGRGRRMRFWKRWGRK